MSRVTLTRLENGTVYRSSKGLKPVVRSGLVAYYPFQQGSGTTAFEEAESTANDGTFNGDVSWTAGPSSTNAISIGGSSDDCDCGQDSAYSVTSDLQFTIGVAFNTTTSNRGFLMGKRCASSGWSPHYLLEVNFGSTDELRFSTNGPDGSVDITVIESAAFDGNWHTLFGVHENGTSTIYFDGSPVTSQTDSGLTGFDCGSGSPLVFGRHKRGDGSVTGTLNGQISEGVVYDRALSDDEVQRLHDSMV